MKQAAKAIAKIRELVEPNAKPETLEDVSEDGCPDVQGVCGGNFDDAYSRGVDDGEVYFARMIMKIIEEHE